jgi:aryl-alcohol dehydrogenase-like predicted oxidoreductase
MRQRAFGRTGLRVSEIGFGAWAIGGSWGAQQDADSKAALHRALDLGVSFIDTAAGYGNGRSERIIGEVLRERKQPVFVATKTPPAPGPWPPTPYCRDDERYSESYLRANVEERLRQLGAERLDLLQLHTWTRACAVSTVIPGIRSVAQAETNCAVSGLAPLSEPLVVRLRQHAWLRADWYGGK